MGKFNTLRDQLHGRGPTSATTASVTPNATTFEGGPGYTRDVKSELFQLAVVNMVGEQTFYEDAQARDTRYAQLVRQATIEDPDWTARLLAWLRGTANMRSAALVGAAEYTRARLDAGLAGTSRGVVASVLQRADEPGELLAYWTSRYGKKIPKPLKRGVADAAVRLYTEYSLLKYDTGSHGWRFADVIDLCHPSGKAPWQNALFTHALDRRRGRETLHEIMGGLPMIAGNIALRRHIASSDDYSQLLNAENLRLAGMTWEDALSLAGSKVSKAKLWDALIPTMGYMALLRNLRNFDEAGISPASVAHVTRKLADPDEVARSRQFPYRFLSAYLNAPNDRWKHPLNVALEHSLRNIPELPGKTLVLVDTSGSMRTPVSAKSKILAVQAGALLGVALTHRNTAPQGVGDVDLHGFASGVFAHPITKGTSVLSEVERFDNRVGEVGHGTDMFAALKRTYRDHDRVFLITDMQTVAGPLSPRESIDDVVPQRVPIYGFNLGGYNTVAYAAGSPNRHEFGGLNDATLRAIPLLESGENAGWPF